MIPHVPIKLTSKIDFENVQQATLLLILDDLAEARANEVVYEYYELHHGDTVKMLAAIRHFVSLRQVVKKSAPPPSGWGGPW